MKHLNSAVKMLAAAGASALIMATAMVKPMEGVSMSLAFKLFVTDIQEQTSFQTKSTHKPSVMNFWSLTWPMLSEWSIR